MIVDTETDPGIESCKNTKLLPYSTHSENEKNNNSQLTKLSPSTAVAVGVSPHSAKYSGLWNLDRWRCPPSHSSVTTVRPGPSARAALTAPTQFMAALLPTNRPSWLRVCVVCVLCVVGGGRQDVRGSLLVDAGCGAV